jgi:chromatin segregation and condensation protein Rec8/ScpA/Scc1 (kleisin family)
VEIDDVTIENQIKKIQDYIAVNSKCHFDDLFRDDPRQIAIVVLFMSLLELGKIGVLRTYQYKLFSPIWIYRKDVFGAHHTRDAKLDAQGWEDLNLKTGLVELLQAQIREKREENSLDEILKEMETYHVVDLDTFKANRNNEKR